MSNFSNFNRAQITKDLQTTEFDLLIIGGGITGAGIALDAASRGMKVALIEKGADASIFNIGKRGSSWKVVVINFAFLLMGIGLGTFIAAIIDTYTELEEGAMAAVIFFMAGVGLYVGYTQTKKDLDN
jgi:alkyl hydroperoxide reductase subunit AhpF